MNDFKTVGSRLKKFGTRKNLSEFCTKIQTEDGVSFTVLITEVKTDVTKVSEGVFCSLLICLHG